MFPLFYHTVCTGAVSCVSPHNLYWWCFLCFNTQSVLVLFPVFFTSHDKRWLVQAVWCLCIDQWSICTDPHGKPIDRWSIHVIEWWEEAPTRQIEVWTVWCVLCEHATWFIHVTHATCSFINMFITQGSISQGIVHLHLLGPYNTRILN